ncbi:unnamed protein product [Boreogadus saida]
MPCCDVISAGPSAKSLGARALPQPMGTLLRQSLRLQGCCHETHRASGKTLFPRNVTLPTRTRIDNPGWPVAQQTLTALSGAVARSGSAGNTITCRRLARRVVTQGEGDDGRRVHIQPWDGIQLLATLSLLYEIASRSERMPLEVDIETLCSVVSSQESTAPKLTENVPWQRSSAGLEASVLAW